MPRYLNKEGLLSLKEEVGFNQGALDDSVY